MNKINAIQFLSLHQPMPPDQDWTDELAAAYEKTRKFFVNNPDKDCIVLLLNSFGQGEGFGTYRQVDEVFKKFTATDMLEPISKALHSEHESVRLRAAQASQLFPDERLIKPLLWAVHHSAAPIRLFCYQSLQLIRQETGDDYTEQFLQFSEELLKKEHDEKNLVFLRQLQTKLSLRYK